MYENAVIQKIDKKLFKKDINKLARTLIWYTVMMFAVMFLYIIGLSFKIFIENMEDMNKGYEYLESCVLKMENNGVICIVGIAIGMIIILLYRKKELFIHDLTVVHGEMDSKKFLELFVCFMAPQIMFFVIGLLAEKILNEYGYSILGDIETASSSSTTISMFLYTSFLGPIAEEIVFRGAVLRKLEPYGKLFAIIISAVLFGAFHANLIQGIFATMVGLILGYVAIEYSIKWSILMHILNNFLFSDVMGYLLKNMNETSGNILSNVVMGGFFLAACVILFKNRMSIKAYIEQNKTQKKLYAYLFMSSWMIIYLLGNLILAIMGIEKITV
ncbi:CPBP family intramembrane glutamic endopeptidase [Marinisporobacter balticus]|uniref:CAAX prenyl protease 2/Lysostaphin resistance protein A-like domain-containing protein n=1 Tax=Marinisporobacter balticus TaxID=2018667 RepID=A0A4R2KEV8_9FIRM|nr:CPBP family intramembrane glutamic endopeptidase [Marinisporobacter balticus]TCO72191.1 hypothetical protein EV214_11955 [Marinisporobacter balticus]